MKLMFVRRLFSSTDIEKANMRLFQDCFAKQEQLRERVPENLKSNKLLMDGVSGMVVGMGEVHIQRSSSWIS